MKEETKYLLKMFAIALLLTAIIVAVLETARSPAPKARQDGTEAPRYVPVRIEGGR